MSKIKIILLLQFIFFSALPVFAQVDTAWVRRYNGPSNNVDVAGALAVDDSGNVYVTGSSVGSGTASDYATIKYASNGDTLWIRRYNGPTDSSDGASDIAVDENGNVYVTGNSWGSGTNRDYATIKYASKGDTLWVRRYNGPGNSGDVAVAIALDSSGNVYVTGSSWSGTSDDYATIKYAPNGDSLWVKRYNGPGNGLEAVHALAVDDSGQVYVTGSSYGGVTSDYATIKYASNGDTLWVRRYNNGSASALAVDGSGNVYVTGSSSGSGTGPDYATIKYASNGDTLWVRRYNGLGNAGSNSDYATALALDSSGNVYVTGYSTFGPFYFDYTTIKYAPNGDTLWVRDYPRVGLDYATAIALDDSGQVYVTGYNWANEVWWDYATIKYASNGDTLWVKRFDGPTYGPDYAYAIALDDSGQVYVTGRSGGNSRSGTDVDYATIKYIQFACVDTAGDANGDGSVTLPDIIYLVNRVFKGGPSPSPLCRGDANADGVLTLPDIIYLVNRVFKGGPAPLKSKECCL